MESKVIRREKQLEPDVIQNLIPDIRRLTSQKRTILIFVFILLRVSVQREPIANIIIEFPQQQNVKPLINQEIFLEGKDIVLLEKIWVEQEVLCMKLELFGYQNSKCHILKTHFNQCMKYFTDTSVALEILKILLFYLIKLTLS